MNPKDKHVGYANMSKVIRCENLGLEPSVPVFSLLTLFAKRLSIHISHFGWLNTWSTKVLTGDCVNIRLLLVGEANKRVASETVNLFPARLVDLNVQVRMKTIQRRTRYFQRRSGHNFQCKRRTSSPVPHTRSYFGGTAKTQQQGASAGEWLQKDQDYLQY